MHPACHNANHSGITDRWVLFLANCSSKWVSSRRFQKGGRRRFYTKGWRCDSIILPEWRTRLSATTVGHPSGLNPEAWLRAYLFEGAFHCNFMTGWRVSLLAWAGRSVWTPALTNHIGPRPPFRLCFSSSTLHHISSRLFARTNFFRSYHTTVSKSALGNARTSKSHGISRATD
jgi:hypothetical protein